MANPQKEHGYLKIANELADSFCCLRLSDQEWRVLWTVLRFSYGWNKKKAHLTLKQIGEKTGIDIRHLPAIIKKLLEKCVVIREGKNFCLQKDYDKWESPKRVTHKQGSLKQVKKFTQTGEKKSHEQVSEEIQKSFSNEGLPGGKDILKDKYKDISLRERIFLKLTEHFPQLRIPGSVPAERMDYFLFLIETGGIKASRIDSPVAYMMSDKLVIEPFPSLPEREEEARKRKERERAERIKEQFSPRRLTREELMADKEFVETVGAVHKKLGIKSDYTRI